MKYLFKSIILFLRMFLLKFYFLITYFLLFLHILPVNIFTGRDIPPNGNQFYFHKIPQKPQRDANVTKILSSSRSGSSLLLSILNCSNELTIDDNLFNQQITLNDFKKKSIHLLDVLHDNHCNRTSYIWLTRDPLETASSLKENFDAPFDESLRYWESANLIIWYFLQSVDHKFIIKFEDILMNRSKLKELFDFIDCDFSDQYLKYGDFSQPMKDIHEGRILAEKVSFYKNSKDLLQSWIKYQNNSIVLETGYSSKGKY